MADISHRMVHTGALHMHVAPFAGLDLREPIWIEDCGHWIQQEEPGQVNAALLTFLGGLS